MAMSDLGANLRRIMKMKEVSIARLSEMTGLGTATISNILNAKSIPNSVSLIKLSDSLSVPLNVLLADMPKLKTLRFRTQVGLSSVEKAKKEQIIADASIWKNNFIELEELLEKKKEKSLFDNLSKDPIQAASEMRTALGYNGEEPIYDLFSRLEDKGIKILLHPFGLKKVFGFSFSNEDGGPAIVVNDDSNISRERKYFTVAHELGHLALHAESYNSQLANENAIEEHQANTFASNFLFPTEAFEAKWDSCSGMSWVDAVLEVRSYFGVSYKTVLYRLNERNKDRFGNGLIYAKFNSDYERIYHTKLENNVEPYVEEPAETEIKGPYPWSMKTGIYESNVREALNKGVISIGRAAEMLNLDIVAMRQRMAEWI